MHGCRLYIIIPQTFELRTFPDRLDVVSEIAALVKRYRVSTVYGDRYAAGWVRERFRAEGIRYQEAEVRTPSDPDATRYLDKSLAYLEVEPLFSEERIELLDHAQLARELKLLERRPRAGGRTVIDHPPGGHDDFANGLALATVLCARTPLTPFTRSLPPGIKSLGHSSWGGGATGGATSRGVPSGWEGRVGGQARWLVERGWNW